jgi:heparan-alpha-glucosaminide N-acetyltransferase
VVGVVVLFVPKWPWRLIYRTYRRLSGGRHHGAADGAASPILERKRFASEAINFDEDPDKSGDALSRNLFASEEDEESCENMMKDKWVYTLFGDILPFWPQWLVAFSFLFVYFMITFFLDVPGCGRGYLGPGGFGDYGEYYNCTGGAAGYIDKKIFTEDHIYGQPTCQPLYKTGSYDPEGTLGNLTSIFMVFLGLQSGRTLMAWKNHKHRVVRWYIWSIVLGFIALGLCEAKQNGGFFPLNKNLWSPSFIFATAAMAFFLLATFYLLIDVFGIWNGSPFRFIGMNPILIYLGHEILNGYMPFSWDTYGDDTHRMNLAMNLTGMSMWCLIAYYMYLHQFFISI